MRLRSELIIFFLIISVVPLSAVVYISYEYSKLAIRESVMSNLLGATDNTGNVIDNWMDTRKDDIRVISQSRVSLTTEKENFKEFLGTFEREHRGVYREFYTLDLDGNIIFSNIYRTGNERTENYFIEASKGKISVSDVYKSNTTDAPEIIITNPVRKNGEIVGVFAARISLENLYRIIEQIDIGKSGEVFIVNQKGDIIFHENQSLILLNNINNNFAVREVTYEKNGINEYVSYKGENVLGSYYWLPLYRWGLIAEKNIDEAYAGALILGRVMVEISILAVMGVIFLALVVSSNITRPVKSLEEGALGMLSGNFKAIPVSSGNEIGRLTEIFNSTASELLDIRKKLEMKIDVANKDLEIKNKELTAANEELKKLDELKSDFLSLVSHELKTPLSSMKISAEYLESDANIVPADRKEILQIILRNIDRQTRLINDILDLSKIEAGKTELKLDIIGIRKIADASFENIKQVALKKDISIIIDVPDNLSPVMADMEKLIIVVNNLFENALKFTPAGGSIILSAKEDADGIEVNMKDTGIGIEKEKLEKIFDKFYQVDSSSRRKTGGCGLGLSISSGIIRAHGSIIQVESEPGKGSTFSFKLKKG
ncbi:MAG: two component system histidine kinase [Candidatus Methanoperedens nitroreducens]|uniref:histidine kinase n=1 Tax=Candidatus Methanoperedens nitratireducens TaxID=1392998 RepID=A0A0P8DXM7_9EURY|nr:sensor histidine kinase [Candidatus Methanoperedens sp. BLZ2]KAB2946453.1 MAG: sensor histidine kinase [Candidatus Methanoperedens sp.]KPQ42459.1 MAG: two component system histidine kinase [Candidatus Methanoperedens sp. BLZ1]MBZ0175690.1 sensor histidine kinase [Candidatus Methanoperedens nitroreducens]WAH95040.1 MAG: sensor histidine kinase [Candidatus Methanoperedens sp.]WAM22238.1 MAG: sensor histidine kinase [Candidatus Methanoperedens sp.]